MTPEPVYDDGAIRLYLGDAFDPDLMHLWLAADVLVTDPPYGVNYVSGWANHGRISGDADAIARDRALELWGDRPALVFGSWKITRPADTRHRLIWDKGLSPGMGDLSFPWGNADEEIYVIGSGFDGIRRGNIYRQNTIPIVARPLHPTPKPVPLMRELIDFCPPGVIADPFAGSGSTLVAARDAGRAAVGIEIVPEYADEAVSLLRARTRALF